MSRILFYVIHILVGFNHVLVLLNHPSIVIDWIFPSIVNIETIYVLQ